MSDTIESGLTTQQENDLKVAIKSKIVEISPDVADDALVEYAMHISLNKPSAQVKEDLRSFTSNTDELVDWIFDKIKSLKHSKISETKRESSRKERSSKSNKEESKKDDKKRDKTDIPRDSYYSESKRESKPDTKTEDKYERKKISLSRKALTDRRRSDEDYRRWREDSPDAPRERSTKESSLKRPRSQDNLPSHEDSPPPKKIRTNKDEPKAPSSPPVTFTVTLDDSELTEKKEEEKPKPATRPTITPTYTPIPKKPRVPFVRAPMAPNGTFKNMSLVLQPAKPKETPKTVTTNEAKTTPTSATKSTTETSPQTKTEVKIPPKRLPPSKNPNAKDYKNPTPLNFVEVSIDSPLPSIIVSKGGNMVWKKPT